MFQLKQCFNPAITSLSGFSLLISTSTMTTHRTSKEAIQASHGSFLFKWGLMPGPLTSNPSLLSLRPPANLPTRSFCSPHILEALCPPFSLSSIWQINKRHLLLSSATSEGVEAQRGTERLRDFDVLMQTGLAVLPGSESNDEMAGRWFSSWQLLFFNARWRMFRFHESRSVRGRSLWEGIRGRGNFDGDAIRLVLWRPAGAGSDSPKRHPKSQLSVPCLTLPLNTDSGGPH